MAMAAFNSSAGVTRLGRAVEDGDDAKLRTQPGRGASDLARPLASRSALHLGEGIGVREHHPLRRDRRQDLPRVLDVVEVVHPLEPGPLQAGERPEERMR